MARCGLAVPDTISGWIEALALLKGVAATLGRFDPAVFDAPLEQLAADLTPGRASPPGRLWAQLTNGAYRQARTTALAWWRRRPSRVRPSCTRRWRRRPRSSAPGVRPPGTAAAPG